MILEIPSKMQLMLLNNPLGFRKIARDLSFRKTDA